MTTKKGRLRKKLLRLGISLLVLVALLWVMTLIPAFTTANHEIRDNVLYVTERDNKYNTNMDVVLTIIDEKGNLRKETVKVQFTEGETSFVYDQEYFKNVLDTEDEVYITEVDTELLTLFSNIGNPVKILLIIYYIIVMIACFAFMMSVFSILP